ncbi:MAG TPA: PilZ domain-containing protein [Candidatus Nitrosotenuis sp.]|nr:PilZ domain-containing protein [Candidatus Nitrosotenuis sp.]
MAGKKKVPQERRRYARISPDREIVCRIPGARVVHVLGVGVSGGGMRILTETQLTAPQFPVELDLGDGLPPLNLPARVVWQETQDFDFCNRYITGIEFADLDQAARRRLASLASSEETAV